MLQCSEKKKKEVEKLERQSEGQPRLDWLHYLHVYSIKIIYRKGFVN